MASSCEAETPAATSSSTSLGTKRVSPAGGGKKPLRLDGPESPPPPEEAPPVSLFAEVTLFLVPVPVVGGRFVVTGVPPGSLTVMIGPRGGWAPPRRGLSPRVGPSPRGGRLASLPSVRDVLEVPIRPCFRVFNRVERCTFVRVMRVVLPNRPVAPRWLDAVNPG